MARFAAVLIGLVFSNFAYQYFTGQNWPLAIDRSMFQFTAVAVCALLTRTS
jgi:hypothetical protein